jgi:hypothetical protein
MSTEQASRYCKRCNRQMLVARAATNHVLHLILSVLSLGFWIPIWILSSIKFGGWRCQVCGGKA